jgi:uncharacterized peroxidase-related enzyme
MESHAHFLREQGADPMTIDALCSGALEDAGLSPALTELMRFAEELTRSPEAVPDERITALRAHGYRDEQIAEAVYVVGLFNFYNRVASAFALIPDDR